MVMFAFPMAHQVLVAWKCSQGANGKQLALTAGIFLMLMLFADSWDFEEQEGPTTSPTCSWMALDLERL